MRINTEATTMETKELADRIISEHERHERLSRAHAALFALQPTDTEDPDAIEAVRGFLAEHEGPELELLSDVVALAGSKSVMFEHDSHGVSLLVGFFSIARGGSLVEVLSAARLALARRVKLESGLDSNAPPPMAAEIDPSDVECF